MALEYNERMAADRFARFTKANHIHIVVEGEMKRMGKSGEKEFVELLFKLNPEFVVVDVLAKLKRQNTGRKDAEYQAMTKIKELFDFYDKYCLVLTHSGEPTGTNSYDPFDKIIGSAALQGVTES